MLGRPDIVDIKIKRITNTLIALDPVDGSIRARLYHHAPVSNPQPPTHASASFSNMLVDLVLAPERGHALLLLRVVRDLPGVAGLHLERGTDCGGSKIIKFRFWVVWVVIWTVILAEEAGLLEGSSIDHIL